MIYLRIERECKKWNNYFYKVILTSQLFKENNNNNNYVQAGAELCQAQVKLGYPASLG